MKIAVCFKTIADYSRLSQGDWTWDKDYFVDTSFVRRIFNCYDESALEMALKLSTPMGPSTVQAELTALTVDEPQSDLFLKHLIATGYDHAIRIQCNRDMRFNPSAISCLLAKQIKQGGYDLVLLGMQGGDGDNCQAGLLVAERLRWPCIREATRVVRTQESDRLEVSSKIDGATLVQTVKLPLVLTIGQSLDSPFLRFPTLKQKLDARTRRITVLSSDALEGGNDAWGNLINGRDKTLIDLGRPQAKKFCVFLEDPDTRNLAHRLFAQHLKGRLTP